MKTEMQIQNENVVKLLNLTLANPSLRILPMVDSEIVADDGHSWWAGSFGKPEIDEIFVKDERIYIRSADEETLIDEICFNLDDNISEEEAEKLAKEEVASYEWEKVIAVSINLP